MNTHASRHIISVSELNDVSRRLLESELRNIWVEGEISNFSAPSSGHWYFTLKDHNAQIRCAMFRNRNMRAGLRPRNGDQVLLRGTVSIYGARGDYQLIVESMEPAGLGALQRALEVLKQKLAAEGLFQDSHKKALPSMPRHLGVITSPTGAALRDILTVLQRRYPGLLVTLFPVAVQGDEASAQITAAIDQANRVAAQLQPPIDVLIVGRGGGSLEDLFAFNDETLARAIFASALPVISAVGHETDFSISDLVADLRAATPSAAAEILSPDTDVMLRQVQALGLRVQQLTLRRIQDERQRVLWLSRRLRHPGARLRDQAQRLDELELRLRSGIRNRLTRDALRLRRAASSVLAHNPVRQVESQRQRVRQVQRRIQLAMRNTLADRQQRLQASTQLLDSVSPLATLARGYAIVQDEQGSVIRAASSVSPDSRIRARLGEGELLCRVESIQSNQ